MEGFFSRLNFGPVFMKHARKNRSRHTTECTPLIPGHLFLAAADWFIVVKYFVNIFFNEPVLSTMPDAGYSRVSTEL